MTTDKDWTGAKGSIFVTNGCSNHCNHDRAEHDYYSTDPRAAEWLLKLEPELSDNIWECACGEFALSDVFSKAGKSIRNSDIVARRDGIEELDFLSCTEPVHNTDIVTNPPFKYAKEFIEKAISLVDDGRFVCMFLKITFLEGKTRKQLFKENPPVRVWVSSSRLNCWLNGINTGSSSATCYAWFVWQKGYKGYPELRWFN